MVAFPDRKRLGRWPWQGATAQLSVGEKNTIVRLVRYICHMYIYICIMYTTVYTHIYILCIHIYMYIHITYIYNVYIYIYIHIIIHNVYI